MVAHSGDIHMEPEVFRRAVESVLEFPSLSPPNKYVNMPSKCIGIIGGEPRKHPQFEALRQTMIELLPNRMHRGLWTGLRLTDDLERDFGIINHNMHKGVVQHQPILVASRELMPDPVIRRAWTSKCWLNHRWSPMISLTGQVFLCEVGATLDRLFKLNLGLPLETHWWTWPLEAFQEQIDQLCSRCGVACPLPARIDREGIDDISLDNLQELREVGGFDDSRCVVFDCTNYNPANHLDGWEPARYIKGGG